MAAAAMLLPLAVGGDAGAQAPAAPTVDAVAVGEEALTIKWSAPTGAGGVVAYDLRYIVTSAPDKSDSNWTLMEDAWSSGPLQAMLTGLTNGTSYDVQVRASTADDEGAWSTTVAAAPAEAGDTFAGAISIVDGLGVRGSLDSSTDVDYFRLDHSGPRREFYIFTRGDTDTRGRLYGGGATITSADDSMAVSGPRNFMIFGGYLSPGTYYVIVSGWAGAQGPYTLHAGTLMETTGISDATPVEVGEVVPGVFSTAGRGTGPTDVDYFRLDLPNDTEVTIRAGGQLNDMVRGADRTAVVDTGGAILDSSGNPIVTNDDGNLWPEQRQFAIRTELAAGTYYIQVRPKSNLLLTLIGQGLKTTGFYEVHIDAAPEPGSTVAGAARLEPDDGAGGAIDPAGDVDWFRMVLARPTRVLVSAYSGDVDIDVSLADEHGTALPHPFYEVRKIDRLLAATGYQQILSTTLAAGTYHLRVEAADPTATGSYLLLLQRDRAYDRLQRRCPSPPAGIEDPLLGCQWHLVNDGRLGGTAGEDINLGTVWSTTMGAGVNVAVVDSGLDRFHEDLVDNVDASRNHSYRAIGDTFGDRRSHGTGAAGLIAARDNRLGMRGVAPRASIYVYDLLANFTDANSADAAARGRRTTSISSNSWAVQNDAGVAHSPRLWDLAVESGLREGDGGKGILYVFAAGNGDASGEWASLDERKSHHGTTIVCAVDAHGRRAAYSTRGPNLWVCAPSDAGHKPAPRIATTYWLSAYEDRYGGTSAATPIVAGAAALVRSAGPSLTWRDVRLILAHTARKNDPTDSGWMEAGRRHGTGPASGQLYEFNHKYGFGVVGTSAAVLLASTWTNLPALRTASATSTRSASIADGGAAISRRVDIDTPIDFVEWIELEASLRAPAFRDLEIELVSPSNHGVRL